MRLKYITILLFFTLISTSCTILKKSVLSEKDTQKKELKFMYFFDEANKNRLDGNFQKALEQYTAATEINPKSAASYFYAASIYITDNDYISASIFASEAVELQPNNFWYNLEKADLLNKIGEQEEAVIIYKNLIKKYPDKEMVYNKLIKIYTEKKDIKNLIFTYESKQKNFDYSPETAVKLFNFYLRNNDYKKAEKTIIKLNKKYTDELKYKGMEAEYYYSVNQINKAEKIYQELLKNYPENTDVNLSYALFCKKTKKQNEYFRITKKLISSDLEIAKKTNLLVSGQYRNFPKNQYFELLQKLYNYNPNEILANTFLAEYYINENNKGKAIPFVRNALKLNSADFNIAIMLFSLSYDIKDFENLSKDTEKYLSYFPNQPQIFLYKGIADYNLRKYNEAEKYLKYGKNLVIDNLALEDQFNFYSALNFKKLKQFNKALSLAELIIKHNNKDIKIYELYGDLLFVENKKNKALTYWKQAQNNGNNSQILQYKINHIQTLNIDEILK